MSTSWDFVLCNPAPGENVTVFNSLNSLKSFTDNQGSIEDHRNGIGIPLLSTDFNTEPTKWLSETEYISIYRYLPSPPDENRPFDEAKDRHLFCVVSKTSFSRYTRFVLQFTPDPYNVKDIFEVVIVQLGCGGSSTSDNDAPFDVSEYNGYRYRWVHTSQSSNWCFGLQVLEDGKPSLVDGLDSEYQLVDSKTPRINVAPFTSSTMVVGQMSSYPLDYPQWCSQSAIFQYAQELPEGQNNDIESVCSVSEEGLVFLSMALVFKRIQDEISIGSPPRYEEVSGRNAEQVPHPSQGVAGGTVNNVTNVYNNTTVVNSRGMVSPILPFAPLMIMPLVVRRRRRVMVPIMVGARRPPVLLVPSRRFGPPIILGAQNWIWT